MYMHSYMCSIVNSLYFRVLLCAWEGCCWLRCVHCSPGIMLTPLGDSLTSHCGTHSRGLVRWVDTQVVTTHCYEIILL